MTGFWRRLWRRPDAVLADAGRQSELVVARVRVAVTLLLLLVPLANLIVQPAFFEHRIGFGVTMAAVLATLAVWIAVRRDRRPHWLGLASTAFDVSLVSLALFTYTLTGQPLVSVNSRVAFEVYFLAIAATCLRYDVRLCILAGALSVAQYLAIVVIAWSAYDLSALPEQIAAYGNFDWGSQVSRVFLLMIASALSSVIVLRARDLRRLSAIDRLTGVFNRGHLDERILGELGRAQRVQRPLSIAMLDVDHFKEFNDRYGHAAGDAGLRAIAERVRLMTRRSDVLARYGGEEFVLLLPDTSPEVALEKLEEIRAEVQSLVIELPRGLGQVSLTLSAGIATYPHDGTDAAELVDEADARLFRAKGLGRNRIVGGAATHPSATLHRAG
ncbi:MAG TPA: GGDEF domain-containing protein [Gemmatimonadales bacterium]|nr:GGDEF domain-containing protein [Gemmatimonadales bacterium]